MKIIKSFLLITILSFVPIVNADVVVIVHPDNGAVISDSDISRIFLGKLKKFPSGEKAIPVNSKFGSDTRNQFDKKVLKKSSSQIKAYWSKRVFSGKGKPPKELTNDKDIIALISTDKNAIAYIDASSITDAVKQIKTF